MKTYKELINENFLLSNPMFKLSALRGVYKAVEKIVTDTMYHGVKFAVKNPHLLIAGAIIIDFTLPQSKGAMTKAIANYFKETFSTDAMKVYHFLHSDDWATKLAEVAVNTQTQPVDIANLVVKAQGQQSSIT